jgi:hypothetical protein
MNKIKHLMALSLIIICCTQCIKPIPINIPQMEPKMVVNSQVIPNELIIVSVSKSFTSLFNKEGIDTTNPQINFDLLVDKARVTVSYGSTTDTLIKLTSGLYASINTLLTANSTYTLNVYDSTSGQSLSAVTSMKKFVAIDTSYLTQEVVQKDTTRIINLRIKDEPGVINYYYLNVSTVKSASLVGGAMPQIANFLIKPNRLFLYTDADVVNGYINIELDVAEKLNLTPNDTANIVMANIDEGYYRYLSAFNKSTGIVTQLTGEPINLPTNIVNGYGYFAAHIPNFRVIPLKK